MHFKLVVILIFAVVVNIEAAPVRNQQEAKTSVILRLLRESSADPYLHLDDAKSNEFAYEDTDLHGPLRWGASCETGVRQSPVEIPFEGVSYNSGLKRLLFKNYAIPSPSLSMENKGHTTVITPHGSPQLSVANGGLKHEYILSQFHFHWGPDNSEGSKHTFDQQTFPLEMHLLHEAKGADIPDREKLAVVGVLFDLSDTDNPHLAKVIDSLHKVTQFGKSTVLKPFAIADILPKRRDRYFHYEGSVTIPPCSEQVIWTLLSDRVPVSHKQMEKFRHLLDTKGRPLHRNNRPIQELGDRVITANFLQK